MDESRDEGKIVIDKDITYTQIWEEIVRDTNHDNWQPGDMTVADLEKLFGKSRKVVLRLMREQETKGNIVIVRKALVKGTRKLLFRPVKKGV